MPPHLVPPPSPVPGPPILENNIDLSTHHRFIRTIGQRHSNVYGPLEFIGGEILLLHKEDQHGATATSLYYQARGLRIVAKSNYELYEPELLQKIMQAAASLVEVLDTSKSVGYYDGVLPIREIVAGVRDLLVNRSCSARCWS